MLHCVIARPWDTVHGILIYSIYLSSNLGAAHQTYTVFIILISHQLTSLTHGSSHSCQSVQHTETYSKRKMGCGGSKPAKGKATSREAPVARPAPSRPVQYVEDSKIVSQVSSLSTLVQMHFDGFYDNMPRGVERTKLIKLLVSGYLLPLLQTPDSGFEGSLPLPHGAMQIPHSTPCQHVSPTKFKASLLLIIKYIWLMEQRRLRNGPGPDTATSKPHGYGSTETGASREPLRTLQKRRIIASIKPTHVDVR